MVWRVYILVIFVRKKDDIFISGRYFRIVRV